MPPLLCSASLSRSEPVRKPLAVSDHPSRPPAPSAPFAFALQPPPLPPLLDERHRVHPPSHRRRSPPPPPQRPSSSTPSQLPRFRQTEGPHRTRPHRNSCQLALPLLSLRVYRRCTRKRPTEVVRCSRALVPERMSSVLGATRGGRQALRRRRVNL